MLRVAIENALHGKRLTLHGRLAGRWVDELARCWTDLRERPDVDSICVDLEGVTFIDSAGKSLLQIMHEGGATLAPGGCMTRAIVGEVVAQKRGD